MKMAAIRTVVLLLLTLTVIFLCYVFMVFIKDLDYVISYKTSTKEKENYCMDLLQEKLKKYKLRLPPISKKHIFLL